MKRVYGLYAVTPDAADNAQLGKQVRAALDGGARIVQYRNKTASTAQRREQAAALCALCRAQGAALIVNDDVELALAVDADGVHLGGEDGSISAARTLLGPRKLLGASCYSSIENADRAVAGGADHIAFGSFFASSVKPGAVRSPLLLLTEAKRRFDVPVVAIGGITHDNAPRLIAAGADSIAVISALFGASDITRAAREFNALFEANHESKPKTV